MLPVSAWIISTVKKPEHFSIASSTTYRSGVERRPREPMYSRRRDEGDSFFTQSLSYFIRYCDEIDSFSCTRRIVSANSRATDRIVTFGQCFV